MGRRLILDTNVLIAYERGTIDRAALDTDERPSRPSRLRNTGSASS